MAAVGEVLGAAGRVAREVEGQREAKERWRRLWATRGRQRDGKKAAGKPLHGAGVGAVGGRRREQSREVGDGNKGDFAITKNFRD